MMSFVDLGKSLHGRISDALLPQGVVFHHVPKCGGTSVGRSLRFRYLLSQGTVKPEESFRAFEAFTGRSDREAMLVDVLDLREQMMLYLMYEGVRCISLHVRFSQVAYERFKDAYKFVTVLRDPVERFVSHFFWSHGKQNAHARIDQPFEEFVESERARRLGATYVEFFSGLPKEADIRSDVAIQAAIENLRRFDVVGSLNDLAGFQLKLHETLGARIKIGHENKGKHSAGQREAAISGAMRKKVEELCAPDIAVWNGTIGR